MIRVLVEVLERSLIFLKKFLLKVGRAKKDTYHWCEYDCVGFGALPFPFPLPHVFDKIYIKKKKVLRLLMRRFVCVSTCVAKHSHIGEQ